MATYTINEVSQKFDLPSSTLRYYEDAGLLTNVARTPSGQRIYADCHLNRLGAICCFKRTGMSIAQLQAFFRYEADEPGHIDDILTLLDKQRQAMERHMRELEADHAHMLRKLHYYRAIKAAAAAGAPHPDWADYKNAVFTK